MSVYMPKRTSAATRWALRLSLFAVQVLIVVILLHRFAGFPSPAFINALVLVFGLAVLSILLSLLGFIRIWRDGISGTTRGVGAMLLALAILAWPAAYLPRMMALPAINDVTTDLRNPPRFVAAASVRTPLANPVTYPGPQFARAQELAYPGLEAIRVVRPRLESFEITREYLASEGFEILRAEPPSDSRSIGTIEAVDRTLILGFADDLVVRIGGDRRVSEVDLRSASRYGRHDFGRNATRIANLTKELEVRLDTGIPLDLGEDDSRSLPLPEPNPGRRNGRPSPAALLAQQRLSRRAAPGGRRARAGRPARSRLRYQDIFSQ